MGMRPRKKPKKLGFLTLIPAVPAIVWILCIIFIPRLGLADLLVLYLLLAITVFCDALTTFGVKLLAPEHFERFEVSPFVKLISKRFPETFFQIHASLALLIYFGAAAVLTLTFSYAFSSIPTRLLGSFFITASSSHISAALANVSLLVSNFLKDPSPGPSIR